MYSLEALLDTVPESLVGDAARQRLRSVASQLPDGVADVVCLEIRLDRDPRVDLLLRSTLERQLMVLAGTDPVLRLPGHLTTQPAWRRVSQLASRCIRASTWACPDAGVWLEFDLDEESRGLAPGSFVCTARDGGPSVAEQDVVDAVGDILRAGPGVDGDLDGYAPIVRRVVGGGLLARWVGVFPGRPGSGVRLFCSHAYSRPALADVLQRCGWPGPRHELERWLRICGRWGDRINIDLDVTPYGLSPAIGLEVVFSGMPPPIREPRWRGLLGDLARAGLCTGAKCQGIEAIGVGYAATVLTRRRYRQVLYHLKIAVDPAGHAVAKVYLAGQLLA